MLHLKALRLSGLTLRPRPAISRTLSLASRPVARNFSTSQNRPTRYVRFNVEPEQRFNFRKWSPGQQLFGAIVVGCGVYFVTHLEQVPETGRWRFMAISPAKEAQLGKVAQEEILAEFRGRTLPENHPLTRHIRRVVNRILESNNLGSVKNTDPTQTSLNGPLDDPWISQTPSEEAIGQQKEWNLTVVNDDKMANAMATWGSIVVFTGILPVAKDEQGLAAVLGHEIAHVVARHNSERYSSVKLLLVVATVLEVLGLDMGFSRVLTTLLFELPNSRTTELEADKIGILLSSRACYDPRGAPEVFTRFAQLEKALGGVNISFLRTHPSSDARVKFLENQLPDAYAARAASPACGGVSENMAAFQDTFARAPWGGSDSSVPRRWS